ncbi:uncharacterized protein J8A68_000463 [[Candida] subhashii]|uniref:MAGE domain-containing protein n=1 Tax=[Candida] subhashii TaxID=561895 RepID=A0A8J5UMD5_9ASCO|nr:uncharacterized protein J8A68_000463 [[Candida] subhashii]KAG7666033.1 hypothetical protein J8A68_000463 [[Candida] subhashii]
MPKRKIELDELDEEYHQEEEYLQEANDRSVIHPTSRVGNNTSHGNPSGVNTPTDEMEFQHVVNQVIRIVLGRELKGMLTRREHITSALTNKKIKTDLIVKAVDQTLRDTYGLSLVETPIIKKQPDGKLKKGAPSKVKPVVSYCVVNDLSTEGRNVLGQIWNNSLKTFMKKDMGDVKYFLPTYSKTKLPNTNQELVKDGIMLVVVSLVILSENLCKRDYLTKITLEGTTKEHNIIEYALGRRCLVEFTPKNVFEFIKVVYGDDFDGSIAERTLITIQRAYGVALAAEENDDDYRSSATPGVEEGVEASHTETPNV